MSENQTSICNLALSRFGGGAITSLDDDSEQARLLSINYENCLESILRAYPWNFARKIDSLALTNDELAGWKYVYQYPANCINILNVDSSTNLRRSFNVTKREIKVFTSGTEKFIASDVENAYIEYTYYIVDSTLYDSIFVKALSYLLASEICETITGNLNISQQMMQKYQLAISEAQTMNSIENNIVCDWPDALIRSRR